RRSRRWMGIAAALVFVALAGAVAFMVFRPRPRPLDAVETVADRYLDALVRQDEETLGRLGVVDEPPGIGSYRDVTHEKSRDRVVRGSFATLAALHQQIDKDFQYDETAGR